MGIVVAIVISAVIAVAITIPWVNAIDKMKNDPEWREHEDDTDYWDWP